MMVFNSSTFPHILNIYYVIDICDIPHIDFCPDVDFSYIASTSFKSNFPATFFVACFLYIDHLSKKGIAFMLRSYIWVLTISVLELISNLAAILVLPIAIPNCFN